MKHLCWQGAHYLAHSSGSNLLGLKLGCTLEWCHTPYPQRFWFLLVWAKSGHHDLQNHPMWLYNPAALLGRSPLYWPQYRFPCPLNILHPRVFLTLPSRARLCDGKPSHPCMDLRSSRTLWKMLQHFSQEKGLHQRYRAACHCKGLKSHWSKDGLLPQLPASPMKRMKSFHVLLSLSG